MRNSSVAVMAAELCLPMFIRVVLLRLVWLFELAEERICAKFI